MRTPKAMLVEQIDKFARFLELSLDRTREDAYRRSPQRAPDCVAANLAAGMEPPEAVMKNQNTLGPFMTLILTLTAKGRHADNAINPSWEAVVPSLLFARLLIESVRREPVGYANPNGRVLRTGACFER